MSTADEPTKDQLGPTDVAKAFVSGLVGVGASIVSGAPQAIKQARSDLVAARFIGEMAVNQGTAQLRDRLGGAETRTGEDTVVAPDLAEPTTVSTAGADDVVDDGEDGEDDHSGATVASGTGVPDVGDLAIPDYDTVPAIDVVMQLADLDVHERSQIEAYESANRQRRTILGKIDQLRATA